MADDKTCATCDYPETQLKKAKRPEKDGMFSLGLLGNPQDSEETRILLTPEVCGILVSSGIRVVMEKDAAIDINFTNENYEEYGVIIEDRIQTLKCDILLSYELVKEKDVKHMLPDTVLLSMQVGRIYSPKLIEALLEKRITVGCLERMYSHTDEFVFANLIDEIDGRTAIMYAEEALSFLGGGKGVLLGGVSGIPPCEMLFIGEGRKIYYAAAAAKSIGATVTIMDNDISSLQMGKIFVGKDTVTSSLHPRVLCNKIKSADVIIMDKCTRNFEIPDNLKGQAKENVYILDFRETQPSVCVPRTVAMALSNCLVNFFNEMLLKSGWHSMLGTNQGVQAGILTYDGKITNKLLGTVLQMPSTEIGILLGSPVN